MITCINHTNRPVVNKKYKLCQECNYKRLNGRSQQEVYSERAATKPVKILYIKRSRPKQQTKKQEVRAKELANVKSEIEIDAIQDNRYYCWGCGHAKGALDKSHILSVGQFKHLELDKENMNLFCRKCHDIWENDPIENKGELLTFEKDLDYIQKNSQLYFNLYAGEMLDYIYWNPDKNISKIFQKYLAKLLPEV